MFSCPTWTSVFKTKKGRREEGERMKLQSEREAKEWIEGGEHCRSNDDEDDYFQVKIQTRKGRKLALRSLC